MVSILEIYGLWARSDRTYRLDEGVPARVKAFADRHNISMSDMINFLILYALGEVENGRLVVPTKPERAVVDWQKVYKSRTEGVLE